MKGVELAAKSSGQLQGRNRLEYIIVVDKLQPMQGDIASPFVFDKRRQWFTFSHILMLQISLFFAASLVRKDAPAYASLGLDHLRYILAELSFQ